MKRRRNPDINWVMWGAVAIGAYFLWKKFSSVADTAVNAIAQPIADAYVDLTGPAAPVPQGTVIMPDGNNFPASDLTSLNFGFRNNVAMFTLNSTNYSLSPHDANGNYVATRA